MIKHILTGLIYLLIAELIIGQTIFLARKYGPLKSMSFDKFKKIFIAFPYALLLTTAVFVILLLLN